MPKKVENNTISMIDNVISNNESLKDSDKTLEDIQIDENKIKLKKEQKKSYEEILSDISLLFSKKVIIEKIVYFDYFSQSDFQILNNIETSKLPFVINLNNYINILNCLLFYADKDMIKFHNLLSLIICQ